MSVGKATFPWGLVEIGSPSLHPSIRQVLFSDRCYDDKWPSNLSTTERLPDGSSLISSLLQPFPPFVHPFLSVITSEAGMTKSCTATIRERRKFPLPWHAKKQWRKVHMHFGTSTWGKLLSWIIRICFDFFMKRITSAQKSRSSHPDKGPHQLQVFHLAILWCRQQHVYIFVCGCGEFSMIYSFFSGSSNMKYDNLKRQNLYKIISSILTCIPHKHNLKPKSRSTWLPTRHPTKGLKTPTSARGPWCSNSCAFFSRVHYNLAILSCSLVSFQHTKKGHK